MIIVSYKVTEGGKTMENTKVPRMATVIEAAEITGLAKHYVRQLALQEKVSHVRAGKKILINIEKLIEFLSNGENGGQAC